MTSDDPMWNEFRALWSDLPRAGDQVHHAGGYGLFLKQRWLVEHPSVPLVIPLDRWRETTPRGTNDLDIVIGLDLLASTEAQGAIVQAMERNDFRVVEANPRWQFRKQLDRNRHVLVDLHAELPKSENPNLVVDKLRIKHNPSLGDEGVHGRQNPEAAGCGVHPFPFEIDGITISVPNPVTWSVMKLISTHDRRRKSEDSKRDEKYRQFHGQQAMKHMRDVARIVAMTTRIERDQAHEVVALIRNNACFIEAIEVCDQLFRRERSWAAQVAAPMWRDDDFDGTIRGVLNDWFR